MVRRLLGFAPAAAVLALAASVAGWWTLGFRAFTTDSHALLSAGPLPRPAPTIAFEGPEGTLLRTDRFRGRYVLLTFMYLGCPDVCRIVDARLYRASAALSDLVPGRLVLVSLSFDPERDTPALLRAHRARFGRPRGWIVGRLNAPLNAAQRNALAKLGVWVYRKPDGTYNHAAFTFLLDPQGRVIEVFRPGTPAASLARVVRGEMG